jgi:glycosyltransferase involved in cell wall biosynthesis
MLKLNWFSPLPPAKTDIAHYTKRMLPALSKLAHITLWTDQREWEPELEKFALVRTYKLEKLSWVQLNQADITFYQIGNDERFHGRIWQVSRQLSGVVVLHDYRLQEFFDILFRTRLNDHNTYHDVMSRYYGKQGLVDSRDREKTSEYMAERYPLTEFALENAIGVLVHTDEAFQTVSQIDRWPVGLAPLPFPSLPHERFHVKQKDDDIRRLVLFGYIGRNRRLESVLQALGQMDAPDRFHLDVFGIILNDESKIRQQISTLKLNDCVTLHGFQTETELDEALGNCDLAINLRYPTMGEASGSQLRIWAHGLPSLVSDVGWFSSLPRDAVAFVRPGEHEIGDIKEHLRRLLDEPERFANMGERGRRELKEKHTPELYAQRVIEIAERAQQFRYQVANLKLASRAAVISSAWLKPQTTVETFGRVANEIRGWAKRY